MLNNYWKEGYKNFLYVWHRRAGKTKLCVNHILAAAMQRVGAYYIISPQLTQSRRNIWEARGDDGVAFIDHFPKQLVHRADNKEMKVYLKNGSIVGLAASDKNNYEKLRGMNILGYVLDEYATQSPEVRETLIPMIVENGGWEIIISTPSGHNHFYYLYNKLKNNENFITEILTVDDTRRNDGTPVLDKSKIDRMINDFGWSEAKARQELWCDFSSAVVGAVFGSQMAEVQKEKRMYNFPVLNDRPVHTAWDLGQHDSTAIWFFQVYPDYVHVVGYYENSFRQLSHYVNVVHKFREDHGIVFGNHWFPHDGKNKTGPRGESWQMRGRQLGLNTQVLTVERKSILIERARSMFRIFKFNQSNCQRGIDCLLEYKFQYNEAMQLVGNSPVHNWASHGADAFLYMCKAIKNGSQGPVGKPIKNAVRMG